MIQKIFLLFIICLIIITSFSYTQATSIFDIFAQSDDFVTQGENNSDVDYAPINLASDLLFNLFFSIFLVLAIIIGVIHGIKFMTSSAEEKAEIKEGLFPYAVAIVILFGGFGIWKMTIEFLK